MASEPYVAEVRALLADDAAIRARLDKIYAADDMVGVPDAAVTVAARRTFAASDW